MQIRDSKRRPTRRDLLVVIARLQSLIGAAKADHGNDRDPNGFEKGQRKLEQAFNLCIEVASQDRQVNMASGPWGKDDLGG